jgi:hypothetical protein
MEKLSSLGRTFFWIIGTLFALLFIAVFLARNDKPLASSGTSPKPAAEITSWSWCYGDYDMLSITGTVHNNCDTAVPSVSVIFDLFDASDAQVGQASDVIYNLAPHGDWHFKCPIFTDRVKKARPEELRGKWY